MNGVGATGRVRLFVRQLTRRHCVLVSPGRLFDPVVFDSDTEEMESTLFRGIVVRGHFAPALAGGRPFLSPPHVSLMPIGQLGEEMAFQLWTPFLWASQHFSSTGRARLLAPPFPSCPQPEGSMSGHAKALCSSDTISVKLLDSSLNLLPSLKIQAFGNSSQEAALCFFSPCLCFFSHVIPSEAKGTGCLAT